ncbi:hypothetical protein [Desulfoferula mesophila]|uniref:Uncharacterized protein n=1 Tax=Desulfoferula mesophila TaxID=3058419 RepID=A0AAU9EBG5_9BACT|nr:hypothetical protein FAK_09330 [Desulfoferula mesophilus]
MATYTKSLTLLDWARTFEVNAMGAMRVSEYFVGNVARSEKRLIVVVSSHMGSITDIDSPGAHGLGFFIGPSIPRSAGYWLKKDACLTGKTKMGYYAKNKGNSDCHWVFSEKSLCQTDH